MNECKPLVAGVEDTLKLYLKTQCSMVGRRKLDSVPQPFHNRSTTLPQPFHNRPTTVPQPFHHRSQV